MPMDLILTEWLSLILRWLHLIAGIAWIGSSFYFIHLDLSLQPRAALPPGVKGEAWQVHGGGFYHMVKYLVAPRELPDHLTWFKWEAYTTWLSGFALMVVVYYLAAELFLIDRSILDLTPAQAIALSAGGLIIPWLIYEAMCRSPLGRSEVALAVVGYIFLVALTLAFMQMFSGRGAFVQIGALIGTIMVANVFVVIIPNQKRIIAALMAGQDPDPELGAAGKQRSLHNNYLTLPVVFLMIANHYPLVFATRFNWVIVAIVLALGAVIRHFFNRRHAGHASPWWTWAVTAAGMVAIAWLSGAGPGVPAKTGALSPAPSFETVVEIVTGRCSMCHAETPVWAGLATAPKDIRLQTADEIRQQLRLIELHAVRSNAMPPGNITEMTPQERAMLAAWISSPPARR